MKAIIAAVLAFASQAPVARAQSSAALANTQAAVMQASALLGVAMPSGASLSKSGLYRGAARLSLKLDGGKRGFTLGDPLEVFKVPLDAPWQPEFLAVLTAAGWTVTPDPTDTGLVVAEKGGPAYLLSFEANRRDRYIYVIEIAQRNTQVASGQATVSSAEPPSQPSPSTSAATPPSSAPPAEHPVAIASTPPTAAEPTETSASRTAGDAGFHFTTTTFADGWVTTDDAAFVKAVRGPITVYLFRRVPMTEQMRPPVIDVEDYFWNRDILPRYDIRAIDRRRADLAYSQTVYRETDAIERATGTPVYIGMNVHRTGGGALNILVVAPSRAVYLQAYPKPDDLESALGVNRFAVAPSDVVGHWSESSATGIDMYYTATGNYAGMNSTATSNQFFLRADGTYTSKHAGASGMTGSQRVYQNEYVGRWSMRGNWELTLTNRFEGKSETFAVAFESVNGGRILHLQNVTASGIQYHLGRVR